MEMTIRPGRAPRQVAAPLSKSEGHRALILAALAEGKTRLPLLPASEDLAKWESTPADTLPAIDHIRPLV